MIGPPQDKNRTVNPVPNPSTVLQGNCAECGFEAAVIVPESAAETVRGLGGSYRNKLIHPAIDDSILRHRQEPTTWSALEYAAHVRDVIALWGWALHRTLTEDQPQLPRPDPGLPDRAAAETSYNDQDPVTVVAELAANAERMAKKVATIASDQWQRSAIFGELYVTSLDIVRKVAHEGHHHLLDIEQCLAKHSMD